MAVDYEALPFSKATPSQLIDVLLSWYDDHRRSLPWRATQGRSPDPYHVLVSEIMLQQTTVATVRHRFAPFIERFPDVEALAHASETDVLHAWQGLGYYRRARALHACAKVIHDRYDGVIPSHVDDLISLPGIGAYTANAIAAIAFNRPVVPVDGNVNRVLSRLFQVEEPLPKAVSALRALAREFEPCERPGDTAQALMDLGSIVCRPKNPNCTACPWIKVCAAHASNMTAELPRQMPKRQRPKKEAVAFLLTRSDGAVLFRQRPAEGLLGGLHELPSSRWESAPINRDAALNEAPVKASWRFHIGKVRHVFTHFVLDLHLAEAQLDDAPTGFWQHPKAFDELALPTLMKKLLRQAGHL